MTWRAKWIAVLVTSASLAHAEPICRKVARSDVPYDPVVDGLERIAAKKHYVTDPALVTTVECIDLTDKWWTIGYPWVHPDVTSRPPAALTYHPRDFIQLAIKKGNRKLYLYSPSVSFRITLDRDGHPINTRVLDWKGHVIKGTTTTLAPLTRGFL